MSNAKDDHKDEEKKDRKRNFIERHIPKGAVKPIAYVVAYGVVSGTVSHLLHLPKDHPLSPVFFVPKGMLGTSSSASTMSTTSFQP
jgi:inorganic pyrophosphatase